MASSSPDQRLGSNASIRPPAGASAAAELPPPRRGRPEAPPSDELDRLLEAALDEDVGPGDLTSEGAVPFDARARARLVAKEPGVLAGLPFFLRVFELCDARSVRRALAEEGSRVEAGQVVATIEGQARALLKAERTALNLLQRLSGVATQTARWVELAGDSVRVLDTRKTTPGLRALEKYAVRCGGGENHRFGLFDEVMLKENHIDLAGAPLEEVLPSLRARVGLGVRITAEARDAEEARRAVVGGADVVMLDNMPTATMASLCPELRALAAEVGHVIEIEASGGDHR